MCFCFVRLYGLVWFDWVAKPWFCLLYLFGFCLKGLIGLLLQVDLLVELCCVCGGFVSFCKVFACC